MKTLSIFLLLCSSVLAQATVSTPSILDGLNNPRQVGNLLLVDTDSKPTVKQIGLIEAKDATSVVAFDSNFSAPEVVKVVDGAWAITTPGKYMVIVQFPTSTQFLPILIGTPVPPKPDPGPTPIPPGPSPVNNTYGVGEVAYRLAPKHAPTIAKYASVYEQAGDFLFGKPTLKAIKYANDTDSNNPDRSVLAWIHQQISNIQCPDVATCQQWKAWQTGVREAFNKAQEKQQFSAKDWHAAFNEVAEALRQVQ